MRQVMHLFVILSIITTVAFCVTYTLVSVASEQSVVEMLEISPVTTVFGLISIAVIASCLALLAAAGYVKTFVNE